jgi:hypothetical protein
MSEKPMKAPTPRTDGIAPGSGSRIPQEPIKPPSSPPRSPTPDTHGIVPGSGSRIPMPPTEKK